MATVKARTPGWDRSETQRRVVHPLARLRGYIRFYVSAEGVAVLLLFVALWFWIGLVLDYGVFKVLGFDWVQEAHWGLRLAALCVLSAGLVAVVILKMLFRVFREFRPGALALVLERRFPKMLGDRLITAVEMADLRLADRYGYSQPMIDQTIREAAERVDRLPLGQVFNWRRLRLYGFFVALATLGFYLLTAAGYCAIQLTSRADTFALEFADVAAIWFERNILLNDTIWPRQAHLLILNKEFAQGNEMRIGRDATALTLQVRALKWVIADTDRSRAPEGWRPLTWQDLMDRRDILEERVAAVPANLQPADWRGTVDEIDLELEKEAVSRLPESAALLDVLAKLDERAASYSMTRKLRKLQIPEEVKVKYWGATVSSEQSLTKLAGNDYAGTLADLKESVRFHVRGKDYRTPVKKITVVPPPELEELILDQEQPAYYYHRPPRGGKPSDLRGLKQKVFGRPISLSGDKSTVDVPAGTHVVLNGKTTKPLQAGGVRFVPNKKGVPDIKAPIELIDSQRFRVRFDSVTAPIDMVFEFTDADNVVGRRQVVINPVHDAPPDVEVQIEVIRKTNEGFKCTPWAIIPFSGKVRDDHGLSDVEYAYTVEKLEAQPAANQRAALAGAAVSPGFGGLIFKLAGLATLGAKNEDKKPEQRNRLDSFDLVLKDRAREEIVLAKVRELLNSDQEPPRQEEVDKRLIKEHALDQDIESFDVAPLGLGISEGANQQRYRMTLWVVGTDNNIETGPRSGQSKETFTVLIVSEAELLSEIGKDEDGLRVKFGDALEKLKEAKRKLDALGVELPELTKEQLSPAFLRAQEIEETRSKCEDVTREVHADYRRILKELEKNKGNPLKSVLPPDSLIRPMHKRVNEQVCEPLEGAINREFLRSKDALTDFLKKLEEEKKDAPSANLAKTELQNLIDLLQKVFDNMEEIGGINKLIEQLRLIQQGEQKELKWLKELRDKIEDLASREQFKGSIKSVSADGTQLIVRGGLNGKEERLFIMEPKAEVLINDKPSKLADLMPGENVTVFFNLSNDNKNLTIRVTCERK